MLRVIARGREKNIANEIRKKTYEKIYENDTSNKANDVAEIDDQ